MAKLSKKPAATSRKAPSRAQASKGAARKRAKGERPGAPTAKGRDGARSGTKQAILIDLLKRPDGATVAQMSAKTGWQAHSVRGAISGTLKKKLGLPVVSETVEGRGRVYRIAAGG